MLRFITTNRFEKDYKKIQKQGKKIDNLDDVMEKLIKEEKLHKRHRDHGLTNSRNYKKRRECHIEPDWLLIYKIDDEEKIIFFERTGSHSELFR
ncbi:MAG: type II toxin-antitoxin system YafQ family toxin [Dissulfurispiraceae bacterium]